MNWYNRSSFIELNKFSNDLEISPIGGYLETMKKFLIQIRGYYFQYQELYNENADLFDFYNSLYKTSGMDAIRSRVKALSSSQKNLIKGITKKVFNITTSLFAPVYDLYEFEVGKDSKTWSSILDVLYSAKGSTDINSIFFNERSESWIGFPTRYTQDSSVFDWQHEKWSDGDPYHLGFLMNFINTIVPRIDEMIFATNEFIDEIDSLEVRGYEIAGKYYGGDKKYEKLLIAVTDLRRIVNVFKKAENDNDKIKEFLIQLNGLIQGLDLAITRKDDDYIRKSVNRVRSILMNPRFDFTYTHYNPEDMRDYWGVSELRLI